MDEQTFEQINAHHDLSVHIGGVREHPIVVVFSAVPGSGKSTLTSRLAHHCGFTHVANKDVRRSLSMAKLEPSLGGDYTLKLLDKLADQQCSRIVLDRNIDQWYEPVEQWAKKAGYVLLVVRLTIDPMLLRQRIMKRLPVDRDHTLGVLDFYQQQHSLVSPNIMAQLEFVDDFDISAAAETITRF